MQWPLFCRVMETQFYILLSLRTLKGFVNYAQYFIGDNREAAEGLFGRLQGTRMPADRILLHVDLMETAMGLPVKVKTIGCTLDELVDNHKTLTRAIFRNYNLDELE